MVLQGVFFLGDTIQPIKPPFSECFLLLPRHVNSELGVFLTCPVHDVNPWAVDIPGLYADNTVFAPIVTSVIFLSFTPSSWLFIFYILNGLLLLLWNKSETFQNQQIPWGLGVEQEYSFWPQNI